MTAWFEGNILVIDGTDVNGTVISQVTQLSASSNEPLTVSSSSDGFLTILLDFAPYSSHMDVNFLFTQLENDPSQCGTSKLVYLSSDNDPAVKVSISNHDGGTASCPAVLVTNAQYSPGMQLNINSLQGSMVLYGGVDYQQSSNNEIRRFSSMDDVSSPLRAGGRIFLVQLNPGSMINLSFRTLPYYSAVNDDVSGFGQVKFATNYGVGERYSPGLSRTWVRIIGGAVLVVAASFIRCLVRQCREQPEQNDVNSTVPSVHFVSSQPNEGDPLFQQSPSAEAMK
uniref:Uncharacterized protein n=1 Tax=Plectus sambesii TaxID=2011161 RepID=A0A914W6P4_9BILA